MAAAGQETAAVAPVKTGTEKAGQGKAALAGRLRWRAAQYADGLADEAMRMQPLWPLALAAGIFVYFQLSAEPPLWLAAPALMLAATGWWWRHFMAVRWGALALLGFAAALLHGQLYPPVMLTAARSATETVEIEAIEARGARQRLVVILPDGLRARVTLEAEQAGQTAALRVGDRLAARLRLTPVPPPFVPGGYDLQRQLYFAGIGATGRVERILSVEPLPASGWTMAMERLRARLAVLLRAGLPPDNAALAVALVIGEQGDVAPEMAEAMRRSGLAHILSISGLHIGLVAGLVLGGLGGVLALVPAIALRWPVRQLAAGPALAAIFFYAALAGWNLPVQRSFLMWGLVLLGLMLRRDPWSLHGVGLAAGSMLLLAPEALLSPSFQMSFAAVTALIAGWEQIQPRLMALKESGGWPHAVAAWGLGMGVTSLLATAATAPSSLYFFQQLSFYGMLANFIAVPLSALLIMPAAVLTVAGFAVGWAEPGLWLLDLGLSGLAGVARFFAALPGAGLLWPQLPLTVALLGMLSGLWALLALRRWLALLPLGAAILLYAAAPQPEAFIAADGRAVAVRAADGSLLVAGVRPDALLARVWAEQVRARQVLPVSCERGCLLTAASGASLGLIRDRPMAENLCAAATVVVTLVPLAAPCAHPLLVRDRYDAARDGPVALYPVAAASSPGWQADTDRDRRGSRPWVIR
jgi:competence protein ComEC